MAARTKVVPNRCNGKVLEWKGTFGWIQPTEPIKHPAAAKNKGKVYLSQEDVEAELSGVGATVSFFVYSDGRGLGAMNVRPASVQKGKPVQQTVQKTAAAGAKPSAPLAATAKAAAKPGTPGTPGVRKSNAVYQAVQKMKGSVGSEKGTASGAKGTAGEVNIKKSSAVANAVAKMRSDSAPAAKTPAPKTPAAKAPVKGTVALASGGAGGRTKVLPNRVTGTVKEWKSEKNFGWIVPDSSITHPSATKHGGKVYLAQEDVEVELSGIGASVSFFVYSDGNGLGAMNVRPATGTKPVSNKPAPPTKPVSNKPAPPTKPVSNKPAPPTKMTPAPKTAAFKATMAPKMATKMAVQLKATAKKAAVAKKTKQATSSTPGRKRITDDAVEGEIKSFGGSFGWIKLTESSVEGVGNKDLYCMKKDVVEGTSTKKGTVVTCHVYKDAKGFGAEEVAEL